MVSAVRKRRRTDGRTNNSTNLKLIIKLFACNNLRLVENFGN